MLSLRFLYNSPVGALLTNWSNKINTNGEEVVPYTGPACCDDPELAEYLKNIPQAQLYKGVWLQGYLVPPNVLEGLENFKIKSDDVFIITYPKSGTTWTEEILSLIYNNGNIKKVQNVLLSSRVEHLEVGRPFGHLRRLAGLKSPRLLATHLPYPLLPKELRTANCKIIYVARNPKDNAVSYYHHHKMSTFLGNYNGTWKEFLSHYMKGHVVYGSWFDHILPYWRFYLSHPDKILFITFEELKMDLSGMISRIADFVDHPLTPETLKRISDHCTFEKMKTNSMVNREVLPISDLFDMSQSKFMRRGIIGDWKNYFTEEQNKEFNELYSNRMKNSALDLAFEPDDALERMNVHGRIVLTPPDVVTCDQNFNEGTEKPNDNKSVKDEENLRLIRNYQKKYDVLIKNICFKFARDGSYIPAFHLHIQPDFLGLDVS